MNPMNIISVAISAWQGYIFVSIHHNHNHVTRISLRAKSMPVARTSQLSSGQIASSKLGNLSPNSLTCVRDAG